MATRELSADALEFIKALKEEVDDPPPNCFTVSDVAEINGWGKGKARYVLKEKVEAGELYVRKAVVDGTRCHVYWEKEDNDEQAER